MAKTGKREPQQRYRLNKAIAAGLPAPKDGRDRAFYFDDRMAGLALCVTAGGKRYWCLYKKVLGRPVRLRIGPFPEFGPDQARDRAIKLIGAIADGRDPQDEQRALKAESTLGDLWAHWLLHAKAKKRSWPEDERQWNQHLKAWQNRRLSALALESIHPWHAKIGRDCGPYAANRALSLLRAMFNHGPKLGWKGPNPCDGVDRFPEVKRDRFLQPSELPPFFTSLAAEPNETIRDFFAVALFTGQRRRAVQSMAWKDVDMQNRVWRLPAARSKNKEAANVALDEAVLVILRRRAESMSCPWVFPSPVNQGTHLREPKHAWERLCERAGLEDVRMHDLRRTMGSYQAITGASLTIIGAALGHKSHAATAIYARVNLDPVRAATGKAIEAMQRAGGLLPAPEPIAPAPKKKRRNKNDGEAK